MMRVRAYRPQVLHLMIFFAAYVAGCGFAEALRIVPGITVTIWPPGGVFIATLILTSPLSWPWWVLAGCLAEMFAQFLWFHSPVHVGLLIFGGNALCAAVGAWLLNRAFGRPVRLETLQEVLAFVVLGAGVAPLVSATVGSATLAWFGVKGQTFAGVWPLFWIGDATGILLVAPLALVVIQSWRSKTRFTAAQWTEASILILIFLAVSAFSVSGYLPYAFIVMPPLLWAAVRFEFKGVAVALTLLALVTMALTITGDSQFVGDPETQRQKQIMLQVFLAVSAFSALVVAAISRQHQQALLTLRESERQLQQMVDAVPVRIWRTTPAGSPVYFNKRYQDYLRSVMPNFDELQEPNLDHFIRELIHPEDIAGVRHTMRNCFETGDGAAMRFRWLEKDRAYRWAECRVEPRRDENGVIVQWYGASTDIDDEVRAQEALRDREQELSQLVNMMPVFIRRMTPKGEPIFFNKRLLDFFGLEGSLSELDKPGMSRLAATIQSLVHLDDSANLLETARRSFTSGKPFSMKYRMRRADGAYRWVDTRAEPLQNQSGAILQWYVISLDIDDEMRAQEALQRSEQQLQQLIDAVPAMIWSTTPQGTTTYLNRRFIDVTGAVVEDLFAPDGSPAPLRVAHPDDLAASTEVRARAFAAGTPYVLHYRQIRRDGTYRWTETRAEPLRDDSGAVLQWYGVSVDIDDLVKAQEALRRSERQLQQLIDAVPAVIWGTTPEGIPSYLNKRATDVTGLTVKDLIAPDGSRSLTVVHPDDREAFDQALARSFKTGTSFVGRYRQRRTGGSHRWVESRAEPLRDDSGNIVQWYGVTVDIDDQVRLYSELEEREARIRRLIDSDVLGIVFWDLDGTLIDANDAFLRMVQYDREELKAGLDWFAMTPPEWQEVHAREEAEELARTGKMQAREKEYFRKDGSRVPILIGAACFEGNHSQGIAYILDLTERKRAEAALRDRERELAQLVNLVPVFIRRLTPDGEPIFFNKRLIDYIGVDLEAIGAPGPNRLAPTVENFVHPDEAPKLLASIRRSVATGVGYAMKYRMRRADGVYRWLETRAEPMRHQDGTIAQWYVVSIDVDDEVRAQHAEEALRETSDKLAKATQAASLAELSASIAHEVNQPLAAIVANSHACQRWLESDPPNLARAQTTVERIIRDANSAADVVSRIRALFRQAVEPKNTAALPIVIAEARDLMAEEAERRRVRMDIDVEDNLPRVALDRVQVQQVLINLIRNGMEAMDATTGERVLGMRVRRMGDVVQTEIHDRGRGIDSPDKIFEPFFTTKEQGMGMGLAISRSIVESHGGRLWAEGNEAGGATFVFTLPTEKPIAS